MAFTLSSSLDTEARMAADGASIAVGELIDIGKPVYYEETTNRIEIRDASGTLTGYDDVTSGFGYTYTTHYDANLNYTGEDYVDDSGYRSSSTQTSVMDSAGNVTGYVVTYSGGDSEYSYSSSDEYDADWNLLHSEYSDSDGYTSETTNTVLRDSAGNITGYHYLSTGSDYSSASTYDADWNLISSSYSEDGGYSSTYALTTLYDASGNITGYAVASSGGGGDWGSYTSTESLDADWNLISSSYSSSDGYSSTYARETEYDANGTLTGYVITSTWSSGGETYSSVEHFDADWKWLDGDDGSYVDDGPAILPVLTMTTDDKSDAVRTALGEGSDDEFSIAITSVDDSDDTLVGTDGDDMFILTDRGDCIGDAGGGDDTVMTATFSLNLGSGKLAGVHNAGLTGAEDLDLTGDGHDNALSGNAGANVLNGRGGADSLFGGAGDDQFVLDKKSLKDADTITDFTVGEDTIVLSGRVFHDLRDDDGNFDAAAWGSTLRYDADNGALIFDSNGAKAGGEITIALIGTVEGLDADSFVLG